MELLNAGHDSLIEEAIELWTTYAETYRTAIYRYLFLIDWKAEACSGNKKLRVGRIPKYILDAYPELPLFQYVDKGTTKIWLKTLRASEIRYMINMTRYELECNHAYRTVSERITELAYEMAHLGERNCHTFGVVDTDMRTAVPFYSQKRSRRATEG